MKRSIVLVFLLVAQASAQSQSIDSAQTDGLDIAPIAHRSAEAWGLSIDEWQRHTELRALSQGMLSQDLTPLEVLGILADNPSRPQTVCKAICRAAGASAEADCRV